MSGEQTMRDCLCERLSEVLEALPKGITFEDWYSDGADLDDLAYGHVVEGVTVVRWDVAKAWGYLQGAADAFDVTVLENLQNHSIFSYLPSGSPKLAGNTKPARKRSRKATP